MSGFGKLKEQESEELKELLTEEIEEGEVVVPVQTHSRFSHLEEELVAMSENKSPKFIFTGVVGHENTGKTGIVMDAFMSVIKEKKFDDNDWMMAIDFDGGAGTCAGSHYKNKSNIKCFSPWMMQTEDRTAYDYPETHQRVMDLGQFAIDKMKEQNQPDYKGGKLRVFLVTALDLWDSVCQNNMKIYDMDIGAKDAIGASNPANTVGNQWNWGIRSTRYNQLTALCRELMMGGVAVFWETHLVPEIFRDKETGAWRPKWEKQTDNYLNQIIWCSRHAIRNSDNIATGETRYLARFEKCKTHTELLGQERSILVTKRDDKPQWYGLPEIKEWLIES